MDNSITTPKTFDKVFWGAKNIIRCGADYVVFHERSLNSRLGTPDFRGEIPAVYGTGGSKNPIAQQIHKGPSHLIKGLDFISLFSET